MPMKLNNPDRMLNLSSREKECLYWAARGKSSEETAMILNIKTSTINVYRQRIKAKLNCINMTQALYKAIQRGEFS